MAHPRQTCKLIIMLALGFVCKTEASAMDYEEHATSILVSQYETVFYVRGSALSPGSLVEPPVKSANISLMPFYELRDALKAVPGHDSTGLLIGNQSVLVGAKDFQAPKGLGPVRSERCYIIVLGAHIIQSLNTLFRTTPIMSIAGSEVYSWSAEVGEFGEEDVRPSSFYAVTVGNKYLIVTNSLGGITEATHALVSSTDNKELQHTVHNWSKLSQHPIWGYRQYVRKVGNSHSADVSFPISTAEVLMFYVDSKQEVAVLTVLGPQDNNGAPAINNNSAAKGLSFKRRTTEEWTATISLAGGQDTSDQLFRALSLFGFGAFV